MEELKKKRKSELEKSFVKKCKVLSEISTPSFNEKNNEIYHQHHDYSYAKNEIIDLVNDDCLAAIFMYVPACERPKIALVCQKWKRALCQSWGNVKKLELTHWKYDKNPTCLKKYLTLDGQFSFLKSLLFKCGHYLTDLDLSAYGHCNIVPVINEYCPNLVKLRLRFAYVDNIILFDAFSRLSQLKVLKIIFQNFKDEFIPHTLIYSLKNVADTLTDLILSNWKNHLASDLCYFPKEIICVFRKLKALKRLEIGGIRFHTASEDHLKDYRVSEKYFYDEYMSRSFLKTYQLMHIKKMNLLKFKVSDDGLYTIVNTIKNLETLSIHCELITNDGIVALSKVNKLRCLYLAGHNAVIDSSSILLLKNLIDLMLPWSNKITDDSARKVLENSPKMEVLSVLYSSVTIEFYKTAEEISRNRNQQLTLCVTLTTDKTQYESPYLKILRCKKEIT
ncbi:uncharacterized protein LOC122855658 [Aphidius gifuensis]|uniref:uncharacterized protein LOC122855658 n=1 Tax=Aphidius gifuensis TaxID=684658 RepID=UPI001CDC36E6|nr:uncharacterized protein LOC122855658 [Aphidius gifuensis]